MLWLMVADVNAGREHMNFSMGSRWAHGLAQVLAYQQPVIPNVGFPPGLFGLLETHAWFQSKQS
jgi:hypothetical protein